MKPSALKLAMAVGTAAVLGGGSMAQSARDPWASRSSDAAKIIEKKASGQTVDRAAQTRSSDAAKYMEKKEFCDLCNTNASFRHQHWRQCRQICFHRPAPMSP